MLTQIRWLSLRHWLRHPSRTLLTIFGVALGVAVSLAVQLIVTQILEAHRESLERIAGKAELTVEGGESGMDRSLADRIATVDGVEHVDPMLEKILLEPERGPILLLGIDFLGDDALRSIEAAPGDEEIIEDPIAFLNSTEATVVPESFARSRGLKRGDRFELITPVGRRSFQVQGLLRDEGAVLAFGGDVVVMFLDAAQVALDLDYTISRVNLSSREGVDLPTLRETLQAELGSGYEVDYPLARGARLDQMLEGMNQALSLMAGLAIWVGVLLAYNAVEISVRQRRREIAILRAMGASVTSVVVQILGEAALIGVLATIVGVGMGLGMARAGLAQTADVVSTVYEVVKVGEMELEPRLLLAALLIGLAVPIGAALRPALWIARLPPHLGLSQTEQEPSSPSRGWLRLILGATVFASGVVLFQLPVTLTDVRLGQGAFFVVLLGSMIAAPVIVTGSVRTFQRALASRLSAEATVAADHVVRDHRRAALNVGSLVAGVATVLTLATHFASVKATHEGWIESTIPADLFVTSGASFGINRNMALDPEIGRRFGEIPGVARILHVRLVDVEHRGRPIKVLSVEMNDFLELADPIILDGRPSEPGQFPALTHVHLSENIARRGGYEPGSTIELQTPTGDRAYVVEAIMLDFTSDQGLVTMDRAAFVEAFQDEMVDTFDIFLEEGVDAESVQEVIRGRWGEELNLFVLTNSQFRAEAEKLLDQFFAMLKLLQFVVLVIAVLGVTTTLIASVLDRLQEVGIMRAVGSTPVQIMRIVLTEAGMIGGASSIMGAVVGCITGVFFLTTIIIASVGWSIAYRFPLSGLVTTVVAVTTASILAGVYPALWSARQPPLEAIREE